MEELVPIQIPLERDDVLCQNLKFVIMDASRSAMEPRYIILLALYQSVFFKYEWAKGLGGGLFAQTDKSGLLSLGAPLILAMVRSKVVGWKLQTLILRKS